MFFIPINIPKINWIYCIKNPKSTSVICFNLSFSRIDWKNHCNLFKIDFEKKVSWWPFCRETTRCSAVWWTLFRIVHRRPKSTPRRTVFCPFLMVRYFKHTLLLLFWPSFNRTPAQQRPPFQTYSSCTAVTGLCLSSFSIKKNLIFYKSSSIFTSFFFLNNYCNSAIQLE